VPALVFLAGIAIQIAIPAAMFAYILSGLVATVVFARNKSIDWRMAALHRRYAGGIRRRVGGQHFRCPFAGWLPRSAHPFVGSKFVTAANSRCNRSCHVIPRHPVLYRSRCGISLVADRDGWTAAAGADPSFYAAWGPRQRRIESDLSAPSGDCCNRREYSLRQARFGLGAYPRGNPERRLLVRRHARSCRAAGRVARHRLQRPGHHWPLYSRQCWLAPDRISGRGPRFRFALAAHERRLARHSLTVCGQPSSLRAAAPDSLRTLPMCGTTNLRLALSQYANPRSCGSGVGSANRTC